MSKPRGGRTWKERQERDPYVQQARKEGWRSRAVYKLLQIDEKERLLKKGMLCVDLGAAPGSWSQYVSEKLGGRVRIIALDILEMDALPSVEFIQGDFTTDDVYAQLCETVGDEVDEQVCQSSQKRANKEHLTGRKPV